MPAQDRDRGRPGAYGGYGAGTGTSGGSGSPGGGWHAGTSAGPYSGPAPTAAGSLMMSGYDPNSRSAAFNSRLNINDPSRMHLVDPSLGNPLTTAHLNELRHIGMPIMSAADPTGIIGAVYAGGDLATGPRQIASAGQAIPGFQRSSVPVAPTQTGGGSWMARALAALGAAAAGRTPSMVGALR